MNVEGEVDAQFGECSLQLLEIECALVLILGREDDPGWDDTARGIGVDDAAVGLPITQLLDGAVG